MQIHTKTMEAQTEVNNIYPSCKKIGVKYLGT